MNTINLWCGRHSHFRGLAARSGSNQPHLNLDNLRLEATIYLLPEWETDEDALKRLTPISGHYESDTQEAGRMAGEFLAREHNETLAQTTSQRRERIN
jgi:hypothetical protein